MREREIERERDERKRDERKRDRHIYRDRQI